jgi:cyclase
MKARLAALLLLLPLLCAAQTAQEFTLKKVGNNVYAAINPDGGKAGSNSGFIIGKDAVLVVDTFIASESAQQLLAEIRKVTNLPVRFVVNTHYHLDHTGGNGVYAQAGATIIAQRNVRQWERTENLKFFGPTPTPEQKARVKSLTLPDMVYDKAITVYLGDDPIEIESLPGHTGGDSVIFDPQANVVFTGDLVWNHHLPNLIDATTDKWIDSINKLLAQHPDATFVPGHGDVATAADVRDIRDYLVALRKAVTDARAQGKSGTGLVDAVAAELQPKYGSWGFYEHFIKTNIEQTAAELAGTKRVPKPSSN